MQRTMLAPKKRTEEKRQFQAAIIFSPAVVCERTGVFFGAGHLAPK